MVDLGSLRNMVDRCKLLPDNTPIITSVGEGIDNIIASEDKIIFVIKK